MEARGPRKQFALIVCLLVLGWAEISLAATYRTPNFVVHAPTEEFARRVGDEAERFRKELAVMFAGQEFPRWKNPCPIRVKVGQIGAGGATTFSFYNGEVFGWSMSIQGSEERILDSVLPHEITHTILACRFRQPLPRWADEGLSTLVEHESERRRQVRLLGDVMRSGSKIPLKALFAMTEYPPDMRDVMKLYAQGYSVTDYLVQQGGRETFLQFLGDALRHGSWDQSLRTHYGVNSVESLEQKWSQWVNAGSPELKSEEASSLAMNDHWRQKMGQEQTDDSVVRAQSPDTSLKAPNPVSASEPAAGQNMASSAPRFQANNATSPAAQNSPQNSSIAAATGRPVAPPHQAARSRQELQQPVYVARGETTADIPTLAAQQNRSHLELTREEYATPQTPIGGQNQVQPFTGGGSRDPFVP